MSKTYLTNGDITKTVITDAIITLINPEGNWYGGIDRAIKNIAGNQYHSQAEQILKASGLENGQVIIAQMENPHPGRFMDVIFVVDDHKTSCLNDLVYAGLVAALGQGYQHVSLPLMRTGVMLGEVEPTLEATLDQMVLGIERFKKLKSKMVINVVVYKDFESFGYLMHKLT